MSRACGRSRRRLNSQNSGNQRSGLEGWGEAGEFSAIPANGLLEDGCVAQGILYTIRFRLSSVAPRAFGERGSGPLTFAVARLGPLHRLAQAVLRRARRPDTPTGHRGCLCP
jgi:hypothetical protein